MPPEHEVTGSNPVGRAEYCRAVAADPQDTRLPLGALVVVAVGLVACVLAALLATEEPTGATGLEWEATRPLPASRVAAIPGGGTMRLESAELRATSPNIGEYRLYRVSAVLGLSRGAAVGHARVSCLMRVPHSSIVAHTPKQRASYPRPSEELASQPVPPTVIVEFNSNGTELAALRFRDAFHRFASEPGIKLEWGPYRPAHQEWRWGLPAGRPAEPLKLAFASIWRTTAKPAARIACTVTTGAGSARVSTAGGL
jgi:hypothetical protein